MARRSWISIAVSGMSPPVRRSAVSRAANWRGAGYGSVRCSGVFRNGHGLPASSMLLGFRLPCVLPPPNCFIARHPVVTL